MATYREIRLYVELKYGFVPNSGWIADVKEQCSIPRMREVANKGKKRTDRCPKKKIVCIKDALMYYGMIE